jgi:hypothetical protein
MTLKEKLETLKQAFTDLKTKITAKLQQKDTAITQITQQKQETVTKLETSLKETSENEKLLGELLREFTELSQQLAS